MDWRRLGPSAAIALAVLCACTPTAPPAVSGFDSAPVRGTVVLPAQTGASTYRAQELAPLAEQPGSGIKLRLLSRQGAAVPALPEVLTDSGGRFAFYTTIPDGTYLAEAASGTPRRVRTFVRVRGGKSLTTLSAASTMLAQRLGREGLTLAQLDQGRFDEIAAQARGMMTNADLPDLSSDEAIARGVDAYLEGHLVIKQRLEGLIADMRALEGSTPVPTATPGTSAPTPDPGPTFTPAPVSTVVPTPAPVPEPTLGDPAAPLQIRALDGVPFWLTHETPDILWVSSPASGSITRMAGSTTGWFKRYSFPASMQASFMPGQLAIAHPAGAPATVWVANQQHDGRHVAVFDVNGNFLGAIEAGLRPAAVATDQEQRAWVGVAGEGSGQVKVYGPTGGLLKTLAVSGRPFRIQSHNDTTWIATPRRLYQVYHRWVDEPGQAGSYVRTLDLPGLSGELYDRDIVAMDVLSVNSTEVWLVLQNKDESKAVLVKVAPESMILQSALSFNTGKPVHSLIIDKLGNKWAATEDELLQFKAQNPPFSVRPGQQVLGLFPNPRSYAFWGIFGGPPQLSKLSP
ncbi:MAG TPA: hypothetical protein V6D00_09535 [Pantanalinema sp.]